MERETSEGDRGVERKETWTDRDEDGDRRKERQRNLERLKQRDRQQRCLWRLEWSWPDPENSDQRDSGE